MESYHNIHNNLIISNKEFSSIVNEGIYPEGFSPGRISAIEFNNNKKYRIYNNFKRLNEFLCEFRISSNNFYEQINPMVLEFKNCEGQYKDICAELLNNKFKTYKEILLILKVPCFVKPSFDLFLLSLDRWEEYYRSFLNHKILKDNLSAIENEALAIETRFWRKIMKINNIFENLI